MEINDIWKDDVYFTSLETSSPTLVSSTQLSKHCRTDKWNLQRTHKAQFKDMRELRPVRFRYHRYVELEFDRPAKRPAELSFELQCFANDFLQYMDRHRICPKLNALVHGCYWKDDKTSRIRATTTISDTVSSRGTKQMLSGAKQQLPYLCWRTSCVKLSQHLASSVLIQFATGSVVKQPES
jgi:hypothetical protein